MKNYLNFETDIKNLEIELDKLKDPYNQSGLSEVDTQKISQIQNELDEKLKMVYANLDPWQTTMVARHEDRPKSKFFIDKSTNAPAVSGALNPSTIAFMFPLEVFILTFALPSNLGKLSNSWGIEYGNSFGKKYSSNPPILFKAFLRVAINEYLFFDLE